MRVVASCLDKINRGNAKRMIANLDAGRQYKIIGVEEVSDA